MTPLQIVAGVVASTLVYVWIAGTYYGNTRARGWSADDAGSAAAFWPVSIAVGLFVVAFRLGARRRINLPWARVVKR